MSERVPISKGTHATSGFQDIPSRRKYASGWQSGCVGVVLVALLGCDGGGKPQATSLDPRATALVTAMGLATRLVEPDASPTGDATLWLLPPDLPRPSAVPADARVLRLSPRTLAELFTQARAIATALGAPEAGEAWVRETRQDLARISASSLGDVRPHVAALVSLDPLLVAGGESVETELLEIAGAESASHGGLEGRVRIEDLPEEHRTPDLWLVFADAAPDPPALEGVRARLPEGAVLATFAPADGVGDPAGAAARLRATLEAWRAPASRRATP